MHNRLYLIVALVTCFSAITYANDITLLTSERNGVKLEWKLDTYQVTTVGDYTVVEFPGGCGLYMVGYPNLPSKQAFIEIPLDATPIIHTSQEVVETVTVTKPIAPAQEPPTDTIGEENLVRIFRQDSAAYESTTLFPANVAEIAYDGIMRGRRLVLVRINPIQYIAKTGEVRIYKHLVVDVEVQGSTRALAVTDNAMDPIAEGLVLNYQPATQIYRDAIDYLIITIPEYEAVANRYAALKEDQKFVTKVEIVANNPTVTTIKDTIKKYYPGVKYVLLIGGHSVIKLPTTATRHPLGEDNCRALGLSDGSVPSDLYYACLEGTDYYPDVYMGRIPARSLNEANMLVDKLINYQTKSPNGNWKKRFLLCGEFQYQTSKPNTAERLFCETAFCIWNSLKKHYEFPTKTIGTGSAGLGQTSYYFRVAADPNDPTKPGTYRSKIRDKEEPVVECLMPAEWTPNIVSDTTAKSNTIAFWNEGCFLVQHRDHGGETLWGKPSLSKTDVASLSNGDKLPILFSVNCLTGAMDYSSDCFVEAALKNPNGGAVAAIGSTRVSYSWWNDRLCDGFYTCLYGTDGYDCMDVGVKLPTNHPFSQKLGVVLNFGKMYLALNYPSNPWGTSSDYTETEFYLFHCIGDPALEIPIK